MSCQNMAEQWVESGFHGKMVEIPCGRTGIHGQVVLCDPCQEEATKRYPQGWEHRPGDTCIHGVFLNPNYDCNCYKCEEGIGREFELLCHCGASNYAPLEYELDCEKCGQVHTVPETEELVTEYNEDIRKEINEVRYTGKLRVMRTDECGHESCVLVIADDEAAQYTIAGIEAAYPESRVFTEPEENQRFLAEQYDMDH